VIFSFPNAAVARLEVGSERVVVLSLGSHAASVTYRKTHKKGEGHE